MQHIEFANLTLAELTPFPGNAKEHDLDELRRSLRKGQFQPIVVRRDAGQNVILAGNGTFEAAFLEDWTTIECKIIECSDEEALWINLAANRIGERAGYDDDALTALLEELEGDYSGTGWDAEDLADLIAACEATNSPFVAPQDAPAAPTGTPGDSGTHDAGTSGGAHETVLLLSDDDHDELHGHLAALRASLGGTLTNGGILLWSARALRQLTLAHSDHNATCDCSLCNLWTTIGL